MKDILKVITDHGYQAYYVGGYPRNLYMNRETTDYDICTDALPADLNNFLDVQIKYDKLGACKVLYDNVVYDITTFREEGDYRNMRTPKKVVFTDSLIKDLKRRDFIINTLCIDKDSKYVDLLGAKVDIDNKIIRTVKDSDLTFKEDAIRILRAIRFSHELNFKLDDSIIKSIYKYKDNIKLINPEKVNREIELIKKYGGLESLIKYKIVEDI